MQSGMRIDVKGMPVGMQEQAALKLAKEIASKADRVAGHGGGRAAQRVRPKRLRFRCWVKGVGYLELRQGVRAGVLENVRCVLCGGMVRTIVVHAVPEQILNIRV